MIAKANNLLKGFRTILLSVLTWILMYVEHLTNALTGFTPQALKGAAIMAGVVILKQFGTDVVPRLRGKLQK